MHTLNWNIKYIKFVLQKYHVIFDMNAHSITTTSGKAHLSSQVFIISFLVKKFQKPFLGSFEMGNTLLLSIELTLCRKKEKAHALNTHSFSWEN